MKSDIKHRHTSEIIFSGNEVSIAETVAKAALSGADLAQFSICAKGTITGYKRLACGNVLRLEIPADAKRCNGIGSRKCRAEYAVAVAVYNPSGARIESPRTLCSFYNRNFTYEIGKEVHPNRYNDDIRETCSYGIHFFITFEEAAEYNM